MSVSFIFSGQLCLPALRVGGLAFVVLLIAASDAIAFQKNNKGPTVFVVPLAAEDGRVNGLSDATNGTAGVVGILYGNEPQRAVHWSVTEANSGISTTMQELSGISNGSIVTPWAINKGGVIVGDEERVGNTPRFVPLVWPSKSNAPMELEVPDLFEENILLEDGTTLSDEDAFVGDISNNGIIVGEVRKAGGADSLTYFVAWKTKLNDGLVVVEDVLTMPLGEEGGRNPSISSDGRIVAISTRDLLAGSDVAYRMQLHWDEVAKELSVVPDSTVALLPSDAVAFEVNTSGLVVGAWDNFISSGLNFGFAVGSDGTLLNLPTLPSFRLSGVRFTYRIFSARVVNDVNEVVTHQWAQSSSGGGLARNRDALCVAGGTTATDLSTFASNWYAGSTSAINNDGWIAGWTIEADFSRRPTVIVR